MPREVSLTVGSFPRQLNKKPSCYLVHGAVAADEGVSGLSVVPVVSAALLASTVREIRGRPLIWSRVRCSRTRLQIHRSARASEQIPRRCAPRDDRQTTFAPSASLAPAPSPPGAASPAAGLPPTR